MTRLLPIFRLSNPDVRLTICLQKEVPLPPMDDCISVIIENLDSGSDLYAISDICLHSSKMQGIGFMVLDPVCAGLPVITTDYPTYEGFHSAI